MKHNYIMRLMGATLLVIAPVMTGEAARLTPEEALQRVAGNSVVQKMPARDSFKLAYTEQSEGEDILYVFNKGDQGFIVLSADDRLPAILGYSDEGMLDSENIPPQMQWWFGQYAQEATAFLAKGQGATRAASATDTRAGRVEIAPMIKTKWNQDAPYNLYCPEDEGGKCPTGCVATAMAQVIKYNGFPKKGTGNHSYTWNKLTYTVPEEVTLSFDYAATTFDYANMLDTYPAGGHGVSDAEKDAVATLMYACGVGVNMGYSSTDAGSGAGDYGVPYALRKFFGYDNDVRYIKKIYYTPEDWEEMLYSELHAGRPVIYGGRTYEGGHEFVCDGYKDGYFHINWGWGGQADGNFLLSALNPIDQGIGSFEGGYNLDQCMVIGIEPGDGEYEAEYSICSTGSLVVDEVVSNQILYVSIVNGMITNFSPDEGDVPLRLKMEADNGKDYYGTPYNYKFSYALESYSGYTGLGFFIPDNLYAGNYKTYMQYQEPDGDWEEIDFPVTMPGYLNAVVDNAGNITFTPGAPEVKATIDVVDFAPARTVESGYATPFNISIKNTGKYEYTGAIQIRVYKNGTNEEIESARNEFNVDVAAGEEFNGSVNLAYDLEDGLYDVECYDMYGDAVSTRLKLWIGDSGVEDIMEESATADVYSITGTLLNRNVSYNNLSNLPKGTYILVVNGKSYKIIK